jgi:tetratricopeptide (TPR) repeat protein
LPAGQGAQNAVIGHVTGSNNTVSITQNQGLTIEDVARLFQTVGVGPTDAHAEIETACTHLTGGDLNIAIYLLSDLKKRKWDKLSAREKYRVEANIGQAMERKGQFQQAAHHYIEAQRYQPQEDRARALEAIAYYHLDNKPKAHALAVEAVKDHPNCALAHAIRIRSAPPEVSVTELVSSVPEQLREEVEILHALGWFALGAGDVDAAERFALTARRRYPESVEIKDHQATVIIQIEARARKANEAVNREKLEEAVRNLTEGIDKSRGHQDEARLRYNRAEAYDLLGQTEDAETDYRAAIDVDKAEPDITRRFVLFLMRHERTNAAIDALRKSDKVKQNHTNRLMLAGLLGERNGPGDWDAAIALLRETLLQNPEAETRAAMVATLAQLLGLSKRHDKAIACLDDLGDGYLRPAVSGAIRSAVLLRAGRKDEANAVAKQAMQSLDADSPETDRMRVAEALGYTGAKAEALSIWKEILEPDSADVFVCTALEFARETGDDAFIRDFCKGLRARGVRHPFTLELEVMTLEKYSAYDDAISVMQGYVAAHPDEDLARVFRIRMSLVGIRLNRPELIEADVAKLPPVESASVKIGAATAHVLKNGPCPMRGVEYAYELLRRHFGDPLARQGYVAVVGVGDDEGRFPLPPVAAPGCAVRYRADDTGEVKWVILEDSPGPSSDREEIGPESMWARDLAGKAVGEKFDLRRGSLQDRTATIEFIGSKYKYRAVEIIDGWEERFPDRPFAWKFTIPTQEDGSPDISLLLEALDQQERKKEEMHAIYRANPISATTFAKFTDAGLLESLNHLASDGTLPIRCCLGAPGELERAAEALSGSGPVVIEPSALATLFFSGQYEQLRLLAGRCVICEGALEEYVELRQKFLGKSHAFVGKFKGKYHFREDDPEERERQVRRLDKFLSEIRTLATMKSGESLADLPAEQRDELIGLFGRPAAAAIAEAKATGAALWTDDIVVAEIARKSVGVEKRVWTQAVFKLVAPPDVFAELTIFLLQWRYFFTRLEPEVVIAACRAASWNPNAPSVLRVVEWLKMPELIADGAVQMCAASLRLIWKEEVGAAQKQALAKALLGAILARQDGRQAVGFIRGGLKEIMQGDHAARRQCDEAAEEVLRVKVGPGTESSKAAWAKVIRRMGRANEAAKGGLTKPEGRPTAKQRAEQRKADRKRRKRK